MKTTKKYLIRISFFIFFTLLLLSTIFSQVSDSLQIRKIYDEALTDYTGYENLRFLTKKIGGRICGSSQAAIAVEWSKKIMHEAGFDTIYIQELKVIHWVRGEERAKIISERFGETRVNICALGTSIGTGKQGITSQVIEVKSFEELASLGEQKIKGKIVFFNRPMDPRLINTFKAYGGSSEQRSKGPSEAAKYGAIGVIVRSLTLAEDTFPHTGVMRYKEGIPKIPAVAICTEHANILSKWLKADPSLSFNFTTTCEMVPEETSYNVVGEYRGQKTPNEIITVGGHIDCWDNGEGAHDDGAGCVQSIDVFRIFKKMAIRPNRTIRVVMFMDEEVEQRGAKKYLEIARIKNEKHYFAIETDAGGTFPTGFSIDADSGIIEKIHSWKSLFEPYGIREIVKGHAGVDISPLKELGVPISSLSTESQRYFDYHHSGFDTFEKVNRRELQLGSAAMASLIYLIDKYGLK